MLRTIATLVAATALLALAAAAYAAPAAPASPYYGPIQGTWEGSINGSYTDLSGHGNSAHEDAIGFDLAYYVTQPIWVRGMLEYSSASGSSSITNYGAEVGYDFTQNNNVVPYLGVGVTGVSGNGSSDTDLIGTLGVSDYFIKGRAVFLEEDVFQDHGVTDATTLLGVKLDFNN
jgi:opacity protein-like surface antigen